jgi:hypothetical protein
MRHLRHLVAGVEVLLPLRDTAFAETAPGRPYPDACCSRRGGEVVH